MADNSIVPIFGGNETFANNEIAGVKYPRNKLTWGAPGTANDTDTVKPLPAQLRHSDGSPVSDTSGMLVSTSVLQSLLDVTSSFNRPSNIAAYAPSSCLANSLTVPVAGGFSLLDAGAVLGSGGFISDAIIWMSGVPTGPPMQGEVWLFNAAVTAINDAAAFSISDAEMQAALIGIIPFALAVSVVNSQVAHVQGLNISYRCSGTANLRYLVRVTNAYVPTSFELFFIRIKGVRT